MQQITLLTTPTAPNWMQGATVSPDHYNTLLSGLPASILDPKYHSWRGLIFKAAWEVCSYAFGHGLLRLFSF